MPEKIKVKCAFCGEEGEIEYLFKDPQAICEMCLLSLNKTETTDGQNLFYVEG